VSSEGTFCPHCGNGFGIVDDLVAEPEPWTMTSHGFLYLISFIIPVIGIVFGGLYLGMNDSDHNVVGRNCIILGVLGVLAYSMIAVLWFYMSISDAIRILT